MTNIVTLIVVLAVSIGLGSVLSWYMAVKLMSSEKGKKFVKEALSEYTVMAIDVSMEAMTKNADKFKQTVEDLV
ncbi:MAG: hypothetical protein J6Y90_05555 [Lachnospiraceae bacterium]|nr:hypothetical protein [Lachnospiraceae bacterium]